MKSLKTNTRELLVLYIRGSEIQSNHVGPDYAATTEFNFEAVKMRVAFGQSLGLREESERIRSIYTDHYGDRTLRIRHVATLIVKLREVQPLVE